MIEGISEGNEPELEVIEQVCPASEKWAVAEDGFVEMNIPDLAGTNTVVLASSRVKYLGLALQEAINTPLLAPLGKESSAQRMIRVQDLETPSDMELFKTSCCSASADAKAQSII